MVAILILSAILVIVGQATIINRSTIDNLQVTMGNYTQFRISGSGFGDDALEDDLARVLVDLDIKSDILRKSKSILK